MSGTSIVSEWHIVSFRIPIGSLFCHILHISSTIIGAKSQAEVVRCMDDSQAFMEISQRCCLLRVSALHYSTGNVGGVSDFGFSLCTVSNYPLLMSEYFRCVPEVLRLSRSFGSCLGVWKSIWK